MENSKKDRRAHFDSNAEVSSDAYKMTKAALKIQILNLSMVINEEQLFRGH